MRAVLIHLLTRLCIALVRLLPAQLRAQFGQEITHTVRRKIEMRLLNRGPGAALWCGLGEATDIIWIAAKSAAGNTALVVSAAATLAAVALGLGLLPLQQLPHDPAASAVALPAQTVTAQHPLELALRAPREDRIPTLVSLGRQRFDPTTRTAFLRVEGTLCESGDFRRLYEGLLADTTLAAENRIDIILAAAERIDRGRDLAELIVRSHTFGTATPAVLAAYVHAAGRIDLDRERSRALAALKSSNTSSPS